MSECTFTRERKELRQQLTSSAACWRELATSNRPLFFPSPHSRTFGTFCAQFLLLRAWIPPSQGAGPDNTRLIQPDLVKWCLRPHRVFSCHVWCSAAAVCVQVAEGACCCCCWCVFVWIPAEWPDQRPATAPPEYSWGAKQLQPLGPGAMVRFHAASDCHGALRGALMLSVLLVDTVAQAVPEKRSSSQR